MSDLEKQGLSTKEGGGRGASSTPSAAAAYTQLATSEIQTVESSTPPRFTDVAPGNDPERGSLVTNPIFREIRGNDGEQKGYTCCRSGSGRHRDTCLCEVKIR